MVKMLGVGMFVAIVVDATLVRALLVPATMRLLGRVNWWLPKVLRGVHRRIEFRESSPPEEQRPETALSLRPGNQPAPLIRKRPYSTAADNPDASRSGTQRPTWEKVTAGRTRIVRANPDGPGWTWAEVDT
jgi:RND superfamily putative drug exporter